MNADDDRIGEHARVAGRSVNRSSNDARQDDVVPVKSGVGMRHGSAARYAMGRIAEIPVHLALDVGCIGLKGDFFVLIGHAAVILYGLSNV
jgi:hypothetical protein